MCETSNAPQSVRTARCSGITPSYWTGISQPANGTMRAAEGDVALVERRAQQRLHGRTVTLEAELARQPERRPVV